MSRSSSGILVTLASHLSTVNELVFLILFYKKKVLKAIELFIQKSSSFNWRALIVAKVDHYMSKFLLIEGYLIGENELNEETTKKRKIIILVKLKNMDG
jgi:hypothetical protein